MISFNFILQYIHHDILPRRLKIQALINVALSYIIKRIYNNHRILFFIFFHITNTKNLIKITLQYSIFLFYHLNFIYNIFLE